MSPQLSEDEDDIEKIENENNSKSCIIPLVVSVLKGNGVCLEFGMNAFRDRVTISRLSLKKPDESEDQLVYNGRGIR